MHALGTLSSFATIAALLTVEAVLAAEPPHQTPLGRASMGIRQVDEGLYLQLPGAVLRRDARSSELVFEGVDADGLPWQARMPTVKGMGGSTAFTARLDEDPQTDFFLLHSYAENGMCAPKLGLATILFDELGRPTPWYGRAFLEADIWGDDGVLDWADWDGDGGVELIFTECYNYDYKSPGSPHPQGFGVQAVYEAKGGYWRKLTPDERAPFDESYQRVLTRANRPSTIRPAKPLLPVAPDLSNDPANGRRVEMFRIILGEAGPSTGRIQYEADEKSLALRRRDENHLQVAADEFCYGSPIVVVDRETGREAVLDGRSKRAWTILDEISSGDFEVTLTGQTEEGICTPAIVWARPL